MSVEAADITFVPLERYRWSGWRNPAGRQMALTKSLPFFRTRQGSYIHRVRSGTVHFWNDVPEHTTFRLWCGQLGSIGVTNERRYRKPGGSLFSDVPKTATLCATCEGRAVGAGQLGSRMICGRIVKFSPREM